MDSSKNNEEKANPAFQIVTSLLPMMGGVEGVKKMAGHLTAPFDKAMSEVLATKKEKYLDKITKGGFTGMGFMHTVTHDKQKGFMVVAYKMPKGEPKTMIVLETASTKNLLDEVLEKIKV